MLHNVPTLGEVADFGNEICQPCTKLELKTKININRETRHFAKRVLAEGLFSQTLKQWQNIHLRTITCKHKKTIP
jgi:hypothetical protein